MVFAAPQESSAQWLTVPLPGQTSLAAIPPAWQVYAPSACRPSAACVAVKSTAPGSTSPDYETSDTAIGLAFLGYAIGGTIGGFATHAVAPTPPGTHYDTPVHELLGGSVVGAFSAGTVIHFVDDRKGHYGYTTGSAVAANLGMIGLGTLLVRAASSRENQSLGWLALCTFAVTPAVAIFTAGSVNQSTAR